MSRNPGVLLCSMLACLACVVPAAAAGGSVHARAASGFLTGIADEQTEMFTDRNWTQLHTKITRYIVPYDAVVRPYSLTLATQWIRAAEAAHQKVLVAFYHSEYVPLHMPSPAEYQNDVRKFIKDFPRIHEYQPWNEANRGPVRYKYESYNSPSAVASAKYYKALKGICHGCTVVGLDVLDQPNIQPSLDYIAEFQGEIHHLHVAMPSIWGLHDYSDTNRFESWRTHDLVGALGGQVWLTETGGIVKFGGAFPNKNGAGLQRAAKALSYMFSLASSNPRIARLYIFQWSGGNSQTIFDAGLTDEHHKPRPGYVVVCRHLHAAHCNIPVSQH